MSVNAVLFDLDGTLLDTLTDIYLTVNQVFELNGYPARTKDEVRLATGHGAAYLLRSLLPQDVPDEEASRILEEYKPLLKKNQNNNTRPYPGIQDLLKKLKTKGITSAVISNKPDEVARGLIDIYFKDEISACLGDKPGIPRKPNPKGAEIILKQIGKTPGEAIYVGDSQTDIETAKNLGVPSVGVTWGFRDFDVLKTSGADFIINKPDELIEVIRMLDNQ